MIRAPLGDITYWDERISQEIIWMKKKVQLLSEPSKNPVYDPQYTFDFSWDFVRLLLLRYSRGDSIRELPQYFGGILDYWGLSNQLAEKICAEHNMKSCRDWVFELSNLKHYNKCFWLIGLALVLEIPDEQWQRLLTLVGGEGEDELLDRIIATRQPQRKIGNILLHPKPYARLLKAIDAPQKDQAKLLRDFVEHWYPELKRKGNQELWWYVYGDPEKHPLSMGSYFGRWCIEAIAAVKAFGMDDSLCLGLEHYPGDLLSPDCPSTHPQRPEAMNVIKPNQGFFARLFGKKNKQ